MINEKYKDRLFRKIFGYEKYKGNLLSLYNALNGTKYTNPDDLEITTIDEAIWMGMKNDVSCIINCNMALYEHQSSYSPNMPLRGLMYFGKLYNKYVKVNKQNIYGSKLVKIPTPQYYVFYNGERDYPDRIELKLSDAFQKEGKEGDFQWTAIMLNINFGKNKKLVEVSIDAKRLKSINLKGCRVSKQISLTKGTKIKNLWKGYKGVINYY